MVNTKYIAYVKLIFRTLLATIHRKNRPPLRKSWVRPCAPMLKSGFNRAYQSLLHNQKRTSRVPLITACPSGEHPSPRLPCDLTKSLYSRHYHFTRPSAETQGIPFKYLEVGLPRCPPPLFRPPLPPVQVRPTAWEAAPGGGGGRGTGPRNVFDV